MVGEGLMFEAEMLGVGFIQGWLAVEREIVGDELAAGMLDEALALEADVVCD